MAILDRDFNVDLDWDDWLAVAGFVRADMMIEPTGEAKALWVGPDCVRYQINMFTRDFRGQGYKYALYKATAAQPRSIDGFDGITISSNWQGSPVAALEELYRTNELRYRDRFWEGIKKPWRHGDTEC